MKLGAEMRSRMEIFMYIRPEQILEQYEIEVSAVSKGRDCFLCETDHGTMALKEYRGSRERAEFLAGLLAFLKTEHLLTEQIFAAREGEIFAVDEEERKFLLFQTFRGAECDTKSREDMVCAARFLARLHNVSERFSGEVPEFVRVRPDEQLLLYEKHSRQLKQVYGYIRSRRQKSRFEELFLQQYGRFYKKAGEAAGQLGSLAMPDHLTGFCHGDFNQHNVVFAKEGTAAVNFLNFSYDIRIGDLANFVRKMMEKNNWNIRLGLELIGAYDGVRAIQPKERSYLYLTLSYPEKFWKIANRYSQSHKAWLAERNVEKLERVIAQEGAREQFLQALSHFAEA